MVAIVGMRVAPVPILRLLPLVGSGVFVGLAVIFREVLIPGAILIVVPVVIVLVLTVVDAVLTVVIVLRRARAAIMDRGAASATVRRSEAR